MVNFSPTHLAILAAVVGLLLLLFWPTVRGGQRLLRNWGLPDASREQGRVAARHLRDRRLLYVVFIVVIMPLVAGIAQVPVDPNNFLYSVLGGLLLAELTAALRPVRGGTRVATLSRRTWQSLVPTWAVAAHLVITTLAVASGVFVLAVRQQGDTGGDGLRSEPVVVIIFALLSVIAVYVLVWLAVRRPAIGAPEVDTALRIRSARVMVGIGSMIGAELLATELRWLSVNRFWSDLPWAITMLVGLAAWILISNPVRRPAARAVRSARG